MAFFVQIWNKLNKKASSSSSLNSKISTVIISSSKHSHHVSAFI
jgi:hypothetical protein